MELNRKQYRDYYHILPEEGSRDILVYFNDNKGHSYAHVKFQHPFLVGLGANGKRNVGVGVSQFSTVNNPKNICAQNNTHIAFYGDSLAQANPITMRDGFYESAEQVCQEIMHCLNRIQSGGDNSVGVAYDHLNMITYIGEKSLFIPVEIDGLKIIDHLGTKLGFTRTDVISKKDNYSCIEVKPGDQATSAGDMFGAVSDVLVTCDECIFTPDMFTVLTKMNLASCPARTYVECKPQLKFRPLSEMPEIKVLNLHLKDVYNRPLDFVSGTPGATIELMHLS